MTSGSPSSRSSGSSVPDSFESAITAWIRTADSLSLIRSSKDARKRV